jgi:hypothetical protein
MRITKTATYEICRRRREEKQEKRGKLMEKEAERSIWSGLKVYAEQLIFLFSHFCYS